MTDPTTEGAAPDDLAREVAVRVAEATARGEYPEGVDDDLLTEFRRRLVDRRTGASPFARLRDDVPAFGAARPPRGRGAALHVGASPAAPSSTRRSAGWSPAR